MLELTGGEPLSVDIGKLFELQSALESNRVSHVTAEIEHRAGVGHPASKLLDARTGLDHLFELTRKFAKVIGKRR